MGCDSSKIGSVSENRLDDRMIKLIQETWSDFLTVNTLPEHGLNVVIRYLWKFAENLKTEKEMREMSKTKYHGKRVLETVGFIVKSLDNMDEVNKTIIELGKRHVAYGVQGNYFQFMQEAFMFVFKEAIGSKFSKDVENAWNQLFNHIIAKLKEGLNKAE